MSGSFDDPAAVTRRIGQHRTGRARIEVRAPDGSPLSGELTISQLGHEFGFGCNLFGLGKIANTEMAASEEAGQLSVDTVDPDGLGQRARRHLSDYGPIRSDDDLRYQEAYERLFNLAVVPFYEGALSPAQGVHRWHRLGVMTRWARERRIAVKGHPLIFHHRRGGLIPPWLADLDEAAYWPWAEDRIARIMSRFGDVMDEWDFINEPISWTPPGESPRSAIERAWKIVQRHEPSGLLTLNFNVGEIFRPGNTERTVELVHEVMAAGVRPDVLGVQAHFGRLDDSTIANIRRAFDAVAELGVPIHVTETTFDSGGEDDVASREERQSLDVIDFYSYAFSRPEIRAVTWWDLTDRHSFCQVGGLLRGDLSPKPAYEALADLVRRRWMTDATAPILNGTASVTGFFGPYEAQIRLANGSTEYASFDLTRDQTEQIVVTLP